MIETKRTTWETKNITITRDELDKLHRDQKAAWDLRTDLSYVASLFSDIPEVKRQIQKALDQHKRAKKAK